MACLVPWVELMWDAVSLLTTVAFFLLSLAYVKGCERL
jgi:hypothetical protein